MEAKDLMFFNKEGYRMNLKYNDDINYHYGSMYFDKNSTDTFKTLGIYTFEKIAPTNYTFDAYLENYQLFNYQKIASKPRRTDQPITITDIKKSNNNASFYSKWIYADNIHIYLKPGDWFYFQNIDVQYPEFSTLFTTEYKMFQVILSEPGRILITSTTSNNLAFAPYNIAYNGQVVPVNIVEFETENGIDIFMHGLRTYTGKKIQIISDNTSNDDILTMAGVVNATQRHRKTLPDTLFVPNDGDIFKININLYTDRIQLSNGVTEFSPLAYTPVVGTDAIKLPYVPSFVGVGDTIIAQEKSTPILGPNTATFTVVYIDRTLNIVEVNAVLNSQVVDCYMYLATNVFTIEQPVVKDNNNLVSLPVTYWSIDQQYREILKSYAIDLQYNPTSNSLDISTLYTNFANYYSLDLSVTDANGVITPISTPGSILDIIVLPHYVEKLANTEVIEKDASKFARQIVFNTIDDAGLNIIINGKLYAIDFNVNAVTTLADWITQYGDELTILGIVYTLSTTTVANDTLLLEPEYENRPMSVIMQMGDFSDYYVLDAKYEFFNIKNQLLININGTDYVTQFATDDLTTVLTWINTYRNILKTKGIIILADPFLSNSEITFAKLDSNMPINISYNIGFIPKSGDDSVIITKYAKENAGSLIFSSELKVEVGAYNFFDFYSAGQKITIESRFFNNIPNGRLPLRGSSYNILDLNETTLWLSYQGAYWDQGASGDTKKINVVSDFFIRYPREGISTTANRSKLRWSWKDTQTNELFLYDLSGTQLKPIYPNFPEYNGPIPLCGEDGTIEVALNKFKNDKIEFISDPTKQQTIFDTLEFDVLFDDEEQNPNELIRPMQTFIGYNQQIESWIKSRLYLELIEDIEFTSVTQANLMDNLWNFKEDYLEITSPLSPFDFNQLGFKIGQLIQINSVDVTNNDGKKLALLSNNGKVLRIKQVMHHKLIFTTADLITETSVKVVAKSTPPYYDISGNPLTENRRLSVTLTVMPNLLAYFDIYGETEGEDERHAINLNNKNLNILQLKDFFIFKEVDINEEGVDWVLLNRKRKELLEIYPQIFNNVSSYKSIIQAINFFGYNDLTFTEYFQNINPDSKKFGQLFNLDLLYIFDKAVKGWTYSNLAIDNLKNKGYKKTNLFSLNYRVTDLDGNFLDAYSREEVQIKLNGLKRWLTENLVPIGAKITDINGKYTQPLTWTIKHDTYKSHGLHVEEYSTPVDFDVDGYFQPISQGSDNFDITVHPKCAGPIEWYDYKVRTFMLPVWDTTYFYLAGTKVFHNGKIWEAVIAVAVDEEPGISNAWIESSIETLQNVQVFTDSKYDLTPWSFTVNELIDPHFLVEINWHSGYGCTWQVRKAYSVIPGFFDNFNI